MGLLEADVLVALVTFYGICCACCINPAMMATVMTLKEAFYDQYRSVFPTVSTKRSQYHRGHLQGVRLVSSSRYIAITLESACW